MTELTFHVEPDAWLPVAELLTMFHPQNSQTRNRAEMDAIKRHLQDEGFVAESIVVNPLNRKIVSGHGRTQAAHELGYTGSLPVVYREYKSEAEHRRAMLRWNLARGHQDEAKEAAEFAALLSEFDRVDLAADFGLGDGEFEALLKEFGLGEEPAEDPGPQVDRAAELQEKWSTEPGQMWSLDSGKGHAHRLICGDCTDRAVVDRVMQGEKADIVWTDPPYGVDYDGGLNDKKRIKIEGDKTGDLYMPALKSLKSICADGAPMYVWFAASRGKPVYDAIHAIGYNVRAMIVWNKIKAHYGNFMAQYMQKHEPCLYIVNGNVSWIGPTNEVTVWDIDQPSVNEFHPTQKPVELAARAIGNHDAAIVADFFLGSGTTLIACEQLGRRCMAIELSAAYVAVALQRFADMTNVQPVLVSP